MWWKQCWLLPGKSFLCLITSTFWLKYTSKTLYMFMLLGWSTDWNCISCSSTPGTQSALPPILSDDIIVLLSRDIPDSSKVLPSIPACSACKPGSGRNFFFSLSLSRVNFPGVGSGVAQMSSENSQKSRGRSRPNQISEPAAAPAQLQTLPGCLSSL